MLKTISNHLEILSLNYNLTTQIIHKQFANLQYHRANLQRQRANLQRQCANLQRQCANFTIYLHGGAKRPL